MVLGGGEGLETDGCEWAEAGAGAGELGSLLPLSPGCSSTSSRAVASICIQGFGRTVTRDDCGRLGVGGESMGVWPVQMNWGSGRGR